LREVELGGIVWRQQRCEQRTENKEEEQPEAERGHRMMFKSMSRPGDGMALAVRGDGRGLRGLSKRDG
jgi:hypothetical protein